MWTYLNFLGEKTSIQDLTDRYVKVDEKTLTYPNPSNVALYKELQEIQDRLSKDLKKGFRKHREYLSRHVTS